MTAPALVIVSPGSPEPRVAQVTHELRKGLQAMRPEIAIRGAFLDHCPPSGPQVVSQLIKQGTDEVVFVPLHLTNAIEAEVEVEAMMQRCRAAQPDVRFTISRPIGPELNLLTVLDQRMRSALSHARCLELDGLVLSAPSSGDVRGSALLARRARQWSTHHRLPALTAVADESGPSVAQAIMGLRSQGRRHIAVGSFFLAPDAAYQAQSDLAYRYGAVSVSEPIGAAAEVLDLVLARYVFAAMELLDFGVAEELDEPAQPHLTVVSA